MPKFKIDMISRAADWDASVTVDAESRDQAERFALKCMANPSVWLVTKPDERPLERGDMVKLKEDQPIIFMGSRTGKSFPAGERCVFMHRANPCDSELAVVGFIDHPYRGTSALIKLSNLERV